MEKSKGVVYELPAPVPPPKRKRSGVRFFSCILLPVFLLLAILRQPIGPIHHYIFGKDDSYDVLKAKCTQPDPLFPSPGSHELEYAYNYISTEEFKQGSIARLSGAVQIPSESFDDLGPIGEDPRWDIMYKFADYLKKIFPRVHEHMEPEIVNTHGLIFTWKGSDKDLKPLLLMAHQDVVPVPNATVDAWTHPPFSGHYDGHHIWGRGSSDCKNQLIAVMETMELLLDAGFQPKRTVVLSFGFDEECSGRQGAGHLAPFLYDRYGKDGIAALVDEGAGFMEAWGSVFAAPGTGEKGATDVQITIRMPGGHSSIPTDHTSIGVLSELITKIEADQYPTYLTNDNPYLGQLQCGAAHSPDFPKKVKKLLGKRKSHGCKSQPDYLAIEAAKESRAVKYLMQTSQAVDVIEGGAKINALPERVSVIGMFDLVYAVNGEATY
jgi:Gly-Xaa carboxypeptidase